MSNLNQPHRISEERITQYYSTISAMGKVVIAEKKAQGETMHLAPLGYKNARDEQGRSVSVPDAETFSLVQEARNMRAEGKSIRAICREMNLKGLRSSRGRMLSPSSMLYILKDNDEASN